MREAAKALFVQQKARQDAGKEQKEEEAVCIEMEGAAKLLVYGIVVGNSLRIGNAHGFVHEIVDEKAENAESQTAVVQVIALVPGSCPRQDSWNHVAQKQGEKHSKYNTGDGEVTLSRHIFLLGVAKKQLADKGSKGGGKHADMQIAL